MDDTFTYVAPVMPRRRPDPFAMRVAAAAAVFVAVVGAFGAFVVRHERDADERAAASRPASGISQEQAPVLPAGTPPVLAEATQTARDLFAVSGSFASAGPGALSLTAGIAVVDGPSTSGSVVSVAATDTTWAAAVVDEAGTCRWVVLLASGVSRRGSGGVCTGGEVLAGIDPTLAAGSLGRDARGSA